MNKIGMAFAFALVGVGGYYMGAKGQGEAPDAARVSAHTQAGSSVAGVGRGAGGIEGPAGERAGARNGRMGGQGPVRVRSWNPTVVYVSKDDVHSGARGLLQLYGSARERQRAKASWVTEYARRAQIYGAKRPKPGFPDGVEATFHFDKLFDLSEPQQPGESSTDYQARQQERKELETELAEKFGTDLETLWEVAGDVQYGGGTPENPLPVPPAPVIYD